MSDIYDDPDINDPSQGFPNQVRFEHIGDKVRGRILSIEKINTRYGPTLKYMLFDGREEKSMLAGGVNLKGQLLELRPRIGDVLDVKFIEVRNTANGNAKIYDVQVEPGDRESLAPPPRAQWPQETRPSAPIRQPDPGRAPMPRQIEQEEGDIFDE